MRKPHHPSKSTVRADSGRSAPSVLSTTAIPSEVGVVARIGLPNAGLVTAAQQRLLTATRERVQRKVPSRATCRW